MRFEDLRLHKPLLDAVRAAGYETPTKIQETAIPHVLAGKDVVGCAQTGTGKTASFALPILQRLSDEASGRQVRPGGVRALVLCPTRELAQQILESFTTYGRNLRLKQCAMFGGVNKNPQIRAMRAGVDILVATPGRLLDLVNERHVRLAEVEVLVLDEADRMLDMGFLPDMRKIFALLPRKRQTLLFSATMPSEVRALANGILHEPVAVEAARVSSPAEKVTHCAYHVAKADKPMLLTRVLGHTPYTRALVFTRTKHGADKVVRHLEQTGIAAAAIHGNKSQGQRTRVLGAFRSGRTPVLVATDIAARGLDVDDISHVINYDLSAEPETYIHRIGRTGRAGASGTAMSFVSEDDHVNLRAIERLLSTRMESAAAIPGFAPLKSPPRTADVTVRDEDSSVGRSSRWANGGQRNSNVGASARSWRKRRYVKGSRRRAGVA